MGQSCLWAKAHKDSPAFREREVYVRPLGTVVGAPNRLCYQMPAMINNEVEASGAIYSQKRSSCTLAGCRCIADAAFSPRSYWMRQEASRLGLQFGHAVLR